MESRIPVPTDNIFKFYALFGLLLFVFSCGALLYVHATSNATLMAAYPELEALKEFEEPSRSDRVQIALLARKIEVTTLSRQFYLKAIGVMAGLAMLAMLYGFQRWHTQIQPVLDETAKVQLEIAKLQLEKLRRELKSDSEFPSPGREIPIPKTSIP